MKFNKDNPLPSARSKNILSQKSDDEILLYDTQTNRVFCLNETVAKIWLDCDGKTTISQISEKQNLPEEIVLLGLERLSNADLLSEKLEISQMNNRMSRRSIISAAASTLVALPLISTVIAPLSAAAQSACLPNGQLVEIQPQPDAATCISEITPLQNRCCIGTFRSVIFNNPVGSNRCIGICGPFSLIVAP